MPITPKLFAFSSRKTTFPMYQDSTVDSSVTLEALLWDVAIRAYSSLRIPRVFNRECFMDPGTQIRNYRYPFLPKCTEGTENEGIRTGHINSTLRSKLSGEQVSCSNVGMSDGSESFLVRHEVPVRTTRLVEAHVLQRMKHVWDREARYPPRPPPALSL